MNTSRRGIPFFCDFYATTLLWDGKPNFIVDEIFNHTRKVLLRDVAVCVMGELHHMRGGLKTQACLDDVTDYFPFFKLKWEQYLRYPSPSENNLSYTMETVRKNGGFSTFFSRARKAFQGRWMASYGGEAWELICKCADKICVQHDAREMMVRLDNMIDACHNNGHCLDKLYPTINTFLTEKSYGDFPILKTAQRWIIVNMKKS